MTNLPQYDQTADAIQLRPFEVMCEVSWSTACSSASQPSQRLTMRTASDVPVLAVCSRCTPVSGTAGNVNPGSHATVMCELQLLGLATDGSLWMPLCRSGRRSGRRASRPRRSRPGSGCPCSPAAPSPTPPGQTPSTTTCSTCTARPCSRMCVPPTPRSPPTTVPAAKVVSVQPRSSTALHGA